MNLSRFLAAWALSVLPSVSTAQDWAQWRGPTRDGQAALSPKWPASLDGLQQLWRIELPQSYSGPLVIGDTIITTASKDKTYEQAIAIDRLTGKERWMVQWEGYQKVPFFAASNGDWIRSTPASDGTRVYIAGMRDVLLCLDLKTGKEIWRLDFVKEMKSAPPTFGFVCSPLLDGDFLYVQAGGAFCKLEKATGKLVWKSLTDGGGMNGSAFSSPIMTEIAGKRQLLVQTRNHLCGVDPADGKELWQQKIKAMQGMNILTPVIQENMLFTSAYGGKTQAFDLVKQDNSFNITERWQHKAEAYMSTPVLISGKLYLHLRNQRLTCFDFATGNQHWQSENRYGKYMSLVAQGDRILALDERGILLLIKANPEKFELLQEKKISEQDTWAHLALSGNRLYIRELKGLTAWEWTGER